MRKRVLCEVVLLIVAALSACGTSDEVDGGTAQMILGRVAGYSGPAGRLEARDTVNGVDVGAGSINADGRFRLELNETFPDLTGQSIVREGCPDLRVSDRDVQGVEVTQINVVSKGQSVGRLAQVRIRSNDEFYAATSVTRIYADRNVSIEGSCLVPGTDGEVSVMYNLNYQRGWNVSRSASSSSYSISGSDVETSTISAAEVSDIDWLYSANPNQPLSRLQTRPHAGFFAAPSTLPNRSAPRPKSRQEASSPCK